jgi:hypothetical protein
VELRAAGLDGPRRHHEPHDVFLDPLVHVDLLGEVLEAREGAPVEHASDGDRTLRADEAHDAHLLVERRVAHEELRDKAVELRLGQGVGPFVLDGVLRGQNEERRVQRVGRVAEGDLTLLHAFQESGLHLGGGAVDLVRENDVREHRALARRELPRRLVEHHGPHQVRGQQVRRELDAPERSVHHLGERADRQRLGEAGHPLEQHVAPAEDRHEQALYHLALSHHAALDLLDRRAEQGRSVAQLLFLERRRTLHDGDFIADPLNREKKKTAALRGAAAP